VTNTVRVECYSGYKGDERPVKLQIGQRMLDVAEVEDRWYSPGATYFRVLLANASVTSSAGRRARRLDS